MQTTTDTKQLQRDNKQPQRDTIVGKRCKRPQTDTKLQRDKNHKRHKMTAERHKTTTDMQNYHRDTQTK